LSQTSAGAGAATRIGRAANLKPRKPLAPVAHEDLGGRPVEEEEGEQASEEGCGEDGGGEGRKVAGLTAGDEGDGEPGGGGDEALAGGDAVHESVDAEADRDPDGQFGESEGKEW